MRNGIVAGGVFFNAEFFEKFGFFDERYRLLEDWPTWLRLAKKGIRIEYYPVYEGEHRRRRSRRYDRNGLRKRVKSHRKQGRNGRKLGQLAQNHAIF